MIFCMHLSFVSIDNTSIIKKAMLDLSNAIKM